jgi:DNA primase
MSSDSVQKIKERLSIVDVVSPYVELHLAGKNYKGKSPFTNERTPSFYVSPERGMYYCFSSSQGGDIFTFTQKMEGLDFKGALKLLAEKAGVELVAEDPKKKNERDRLYDVLEDATKFFESFRYSHAPVLEYLTARGVSAETIARWRVGYAPGAPHFGWRELKEHLEKKGYSKDELFKAGLIKGADAGKEPYDVFRDRIMFPIFDSSGRVVAFSGRILSTDTEAPKYVNSPETELFNKSEILYGYHLAKNGIRTLGFSLAVEGQFDVVLSHQAGYINTVAVSGTALTAHHVALLQRLSNKVVLALDADKAGIAAVRRASELMLPRGIDLKVARIVGGKDPADLIREDVQAFKQAIGNAKPVVEYFLDVLEAEKKDDRIFKLRVREEILPLLIKMSNRIDQEHFEGVIAERLATTKDAIHYEVERLLESAQKTPPAQSDVETKELKTPPEKNMHSKREELTTYLTVLTTVFPEEKQAILKRLIREVTQKDSDTLYGEVAPEEKSRLSFMLETYIASTPQKQLYSEIVDKLNMLWRLSAQESYESAKEDLKRAESEGDSAATAVALQEVGRLQRLKLEEKYSIDLFV